MAVPNAASATNAREMAAIGGAASGDSESRYRFFDVL
jgi:hypothetical protein